MTGDTPAVHEALAVYAPEPVETERIPPGYKQTEVGVIPENWEVKQLGELGAFSKGSGLAKHDLSPSGKLPAIPYTAIYTDLDEIIESSKLVNFTNPSSGATIIKSPHLLIAGSSNMLENIGKVTAFKDYAETVIGGDIILYKTSADVSFLSYLLNTRPHRELIISLSQGSTIRHVYAATFRDYAVSLPKLEEQTAIAAALSDVDGLIAALDKLIAKKRAVKTAAMQQLLTGKTRLPGFSGEWEVKRLGDVVERIVGGGTPSRSNPDYWGGEIPWMTVKDFANFDPYRTQETITEEGLKYSASHLIPKGTIIMSTRMALGKAVIYEVNVSINQDLKAVFPKRDMDSRFLYFWFEHHAEMIESLGSGSTVKGISLQDLRNVEFPKAPLEEQTAIAAVLSDMDAEIAALEARREKTRRIKHGMMQELLTGRTRLV